MPPRIYSSSVPSVPTYQRSIFTHLFASNDPSHVGKYAAAFPAFIDAATGTVLSRGQLKHAALSFAHGIRTHPRLVPQARGATLLLFSPNSIAFPVVLLGTVAAGIRCSPANSAYVARELEHQYIDSGSSIVVTSREGLPLVQEMFRGLAINEIEAKRRIVVIGTGLAWAGGPAVEEQPLKDYVTLEDVLSLGTLKQEELFDGEASNETCYICYSSGTTGKPKGVETTHANLTTVVDIGVPVFHTTQGKDRLLGVLPFFHIYGAVAILLVPVIRGLPVIVQTRFDSILFCQNIEKYGITVAMVVPPVLVVLARHPAVDTYNLSSLRIAFSAAAPLGKELILQVTERFRAKNISIAVMQGYGLTETSPIAHILPPALALQKAGSIGILLPNLEARVVVDGEGAGLVDAHEGEPGELWIRGPTIMKGYLNNVKATRGSITQDGWFKSGDICVRDVDGFYWIVDRRKELIKYKGFQVPPSELESVLLTHSDIADVAVVGVDDVAEATELPRAYVVHANPAHVRTASAKDAFARDVKKWIETKVASHKFLRGGVVVIDEIPKSAPGKILRRELRERAKKEMADGAHVVRARL
ncbi:AMP binding protein [Lyophyllum atratum]|nr:AMP binding protein [Lyophyllum atratum]